MRGAYRSGFDAHTHLDDSGFAHDRSEVTARARAAGVCGFAVAAADPLHWDRVVAVASEHGGVACLGLHPWWVTADTDIAALLERLDAADPAVVGEIGLDRLRGDLSEQLPAFRAQLQWAVERQLPVVVHAVRAVDEALGALADVGFSDALLHGFHGSVAQVERAARLGVHLSLGTSMCRATGRTAAVARAIPAELLMLETDAPDRPVPGASRGEPAHLIPVAEAVAALRGEDPVALLASTGDIARRFFRAPDPTLEPRP